MFLHVTNTEKRNLVYKRLVEIPPYFLLLLNFQDDRNVHTYKNNFQ